MHDFFWSLLSIAHIYKITWTCSLLFPLWNKKYEIYDTIGESINISILFKHDFEKDERLLYIYIFSTKTIYKY